MATEARFLLNVPTQNRPPDSKLQISVKAELARFHHTRRHSFVCISIYQNRHRQKIISINNTSYERLILTFMSDGHRLLYQIYFIITFTSYSRNWRPNSPSRFCHCSRGTPSAGRSIDRTCVINCEAAALTSLGFLSQFTKQTVWT
jgi:hypothetical protein